jgi:hypothetical protein
MEYPGWNILVGCKIQKHYAHIMDMSNKSAFILPGLIFAVNKPFNAGKAAKMFYICS